METGVDVMQNKVLEKKVHNCGIVKLIDVMPRIIPNDVIQTNPGIGADYRIVQAARVSYSHGTKKVNTDKGLIRYLYRNRHTTPFEMVKFTFVIKMPMFIARQHFRHRTANMNEISARYSVIEDSFFHPEVVYKQSADNRQGRDTEQLPNEVQKLFQEYLNHQEAGYKMYKDLVDAGVARETARIGLPQSIMTEFYWTIDLHNLLHYLGLRMDSHAQEEIRDYANAIFELIEPIVPIAASAFKDYNLNSMRLSGLEVDSLSRCVSGKDILIDTDNKREQEEWNMKKERLFTDLE